MYKKIEAKNYANFNFFFANFLQRFLSLNIFYIYLTFIKYWIIYFSNFGTVASFECKCAKIGQFLHILKLIFFLPTSIFFRLIPW
jgi:hypothetical protein